MKKTLLSKLSDVGLLSQFIILASVLMFIMIYVFTNIIEILCLTGFLVVLLMLVMAFNNHLTFKRKHFTSIYIVVGILTFVMSAKTYFG